jgi:hypothetical protein
MPAVRAGPTWTSDTIADVLVFVGSEPRDAKKKLLELDEPGGPASSRGLGAESASSSTIRDRMATVTDEVALEHARLESLPSDVPPPPPSKPTVPAGPLPDDLREASLGASSELVAEPLEPAEEMALLRKRLAPVTRVPELAKPLAQLGALLHDPQTAYVLGFVDGILPLDTIIEVTGLPELDTLRVLDRMVAQGIAIFRTQ